MNRGHIGRGLVSTLALAAIIASCGGGDSDGESGATPAPIADDPAAERAEDRAGDTSVPDDPASADESDAGTSETEDGGDAGGGATPNCDAIFSTAEIEDFFAEPAMLTEATNDSLGQLVCDWESIEGVGDLAYSSDLMDADFYFCDDPVGGVLSYTEVDMGDADAPGLHDRDDVEQLFRTFHERTT